jgi:hypothetical protein
MTAAPTPRDGERELARALWWKIWDLWCTSQELLGERDAPTLEEIIDLIPAEKRIIIIL